MVINKPTGLVVHPDVEITTVPLVNAIAWHLRDVPTYNRMTQIGTGAPVGYLRTIGGG